MDPAQVRQRQRDLYEAGEYVALSDTLAPAAVALVAAADVRVGSRVLDTAAGDGAIAREALSRGGSVWACDLSPVQARRGDQRTPQAHWCAADAGQLPYPDDTFDTTLSSFGAIWAPHPERVAAELFRVTRPGGVVAITTWPAGSFQSRVARAVAAELGPDVLADQLLGWDDEATARARFAEHGTHVEYRVSAFLYDSDVRQRAGDDDCAASWQAQHVPPETRARVDAIRQRLWSEQLDERGSCWMEFAALLARKASALA